MKHIMQSFFTPKKKISYVHYIIYKNKKYIREEVIMPQSFKWQSSPDVIEDFHTISWKDADYNVSEAHGLIEYFSIDKGWSKKGILDKSNPIPKIEKIFKSTIGKSLLYF